MQAMKKLHVKNRLAEFRKERGLSEEHVASLLGVKTDMLKCYELGFRIPNLKIALKLAQIYGVPVRVMLDEYYEACRHELRRQAQRFSKNKLEELAGSEHADVDFCTFERKLSSSTLTNLEIRRIRSHSALLVRRTAEQLGHL